MSNKQQRTAYHEAGHCIASVQLGIPVIAAIIDPRRPHFTRGRFQRSRSTAIEHICLIALAGPEAGRHSWAVRGWRLRSFDGILRRSRSAGAAAFVTAREIPAPVDEGVYRLAAKSSFLEASRGILQNATVRSRPALSPRGCNPLHGAQRVMTLFGVPLLRPPVFVAPFLRPLLRLPAISIPV
jgi:hypothetical protein